MPARPPRRKTDAKHRRGPNITEDEYRKRIAAIATHGDEYAGIPMTFEGQEVIVHESYKFAEVFNRKSLKETARPKIVNHWRHPQGYDVYVLRRSTGKAYHAKDAPKSTAAMVLGTIEIASAWTMECESRALEKLRELIPPHLFDMYQLTGQFLQTSKRSGLTYIFRRLRPTMVLTPHRGANMEVLCALCLHPMGYYKGTWGGVMVPTDEVIAHLMLMRGDEADYWRQANQHPAWRKESGIA